MFLDKNNPTMNELIHWFMVTQTSLCDDMQNTTHAVCTNEPNTFHSGDNSIWTHTMLVCLRADSTDSNKIQLISALLHDIGKPSVKELVQFKPKPDTIIPNSKLKARFIGHEGMSFYLSIKILNELENINVINRNEKIQILEIISLHGTLFDNINSDGSTHKEYKVFDKFNDVSKFHNFVRQVKNDSTGRFFISNDSRKNNAFLLGNEIFSDSDFLKYKQSNPNRDINALAPWITILVGPSGSGKSTWLETNKTNEVIISRDNELMTYAQNNDIIGPNCTTYTDVWNYLTDNDLQKEIDKIIQDKFRIAVKNKQDIIIDMTNMSNKSRRKWLANITNYNKRAIIFCTEFNEIINRNTKRFQETGKNISYSIIQNMIKSFVVPTYDTVDIIDYIF